MSVHQLRQQVIGKVGSPSLLCVTGASGAGKTTLLETLRRHIEARHLPTLAFDSLGVPTPEQMTAGWESSRGWQKAMTWHWVQTAKNVFRTHPLVVLEGSFDPQYAIAACTANRMRFAVVCLHADDDVRRERLAKRGQPELANDEMCTWAKYLHEQTRQLGGVVVDANPAVEHVADALAVHAVSLLAEAPAEPPRRGGN